MATSTSPHTTAQTFLPQIIIDNIRTNKSHDEIRTITDITFKNKINKVTIVKRGGLLITPSHTDHIPFITDINNYPTNTYGTNIYIHLTKHNADTTETLPWLCINQVNFDINNDAKTTRRYSDNTQQY